MESALYGIFTLVGEVSEISLVRYAHSFDFRYFTNSCENPVRARFHEVIGTFSNADFCDGDGDRKSNLFPVAVLHFGGKPFSLRADVRTASFPLSTKREYIFCFYALNIYHFFLIWFPKASKRTRQYKIGI